MTSATLKACIPAVLPETGCSADWSGRTDFENRQAEFLPIPLIRRVIAFMRFDFEMNLRRTHHPVVMASDIAASSQPDVKSSPQRVGLRRYGWCKHAVRLNPVAAYSPA